LSVRGATTVVDSTTVQIGDNIIELNGTGAANGGLRVKDPTSPNTVSGSLLWDSTNDYWIGGALGNESKLLRAAGDSVVSGSSQITLQSTTGFTAYDLALSTITGSLITSASAAKTTNDSQGVSITNLNSATASLIIETTNLELFSSSALTRLTNLEVETANLESTTASLNISVTNLNTFSSSALTRLTNLEVETSNLETFTSSINTTIKTQLNSNTVVSGSSQLTSSYDTRYILSGSLTQTTWDNISGKPVGIVSGSSQVTLSSTTGFSTFSSSIASQFATIDGGTY
jgi:hypothetical protein